MKKLPIAKLPALIAAMSGEKQILLLAQKDPADDEPSEEGLYRVGTVATVLPGHTDVVRDLLFAPLSEQDVADLDAIGR